MQEGAKGCTLARVRDVKRACEDENPMVLLMYKETLILSNDITLSLPKSIVPLLQEFKDIFLKELPSRLPLVCGIEHQINLVPGASI